MGIAFIFPGTGTQHVGMGKDFYQNDPLAHQLYDEANNALGFDLAQICFAGPEHLLNRIIYAQPAVLVHSLVGFNLINRSGIQPTFLAGHSLGEFAALVAAGVLSFIDGVKLVYRRARLIEELASAAGSMMAVMGLEAEVVSNLCKQASTAGPLQIANYNGSEQIVISGDYHAIDEFKRLVGQNSLCKLIPLPVQYPFHSNLLKPVEQAFSAVLGEVRFRDARIPIVSNSLGIGEVKGAAWRRLLLKQVCDPVHWQTTVQFMISKGVRRFIEIGPGRVLRGLVRRINGEVEVLSAHDPESLWDTVRHLDCTEVICAI